PPTAFVSTRALHDALPISEAAIARIWAELLGVERVGRHDNFFALGGHSLLAVTLVERMRRAGIAADIRTLFATPSLAALAAAGGERKSKRLNSSPTLITYS